MRIGVLALLHESNTFAAEPTTLEDFCRDLYLEGEAITDRLLKSHHEIGGCLSRLREASGREPIDVVPVVAFRATPSGTITSSAFEHLTERIATALNESGPFDGVIAIAHGAAVAEDSEDADGRWLTQVREIIGPSVPLVVTLDAHANLSRRMAAACDALIAYRTNPHLDQRERGIEAADLLLKTVRGEVRPTMAVAFLPMVVNIERQCTSEPHLIPIYELADFQLQSPSVLSNSILLGFPYADVKEMGTAVIVVTDDDPASAEELVEALARQWWERREAMIGQLIEVDTAIDHCIESKEQRICLLDMGDNVGGGSAADGTVILESLMHGSVGPSFVCLYDPRAVRVCRDVGIGIATELIMGGQSDSLHGSPVLARVFVRSFHNGIFEESMVRHGGIQRFDQGETAIVEIEGKSITVMLTSRRMVPFSLEQLKSCGLNPEDFRVIVAKGVHAPLAAYREVCDVFLRVNTPGSTCADIHRLEYRHRRKPLFPFEQECNYSITGEG